MSKPETYQFILLLMALLTPVSAQAEQIVSASDVAVIDGNRLLIKGKSITLYAIKAPELGTLCGNKPQKYDCGVIARSSLMDMSAGAKINCIKAPAPYNQNKYKCLSNGYDLSEGMVYTGWAKPLGTAPGYFKKIAREARDNHRGMWRISAQ